ncbi:MAG: DUF2537 domain-containing protein [Sciscionella sp.]
MEGEVVELRLDGNRPVLVVPERGVIDAEQLAVPADLVAALMEWAQVAEVVARAHSDGAAMATVTRRGQQLARRLATAVGSPVGYLDPMTGQRPAVTGEPTAAPAEPTPWATGVTVAVFCAAILAAVMTILDSSLSPASGWLALVANVVVTAGAAPSVLLARRLPVWRWVAWGVAGGVVVGWVGWLFSLA